MHLVEAKKLSDSQRRFFFAMLKRTGKGGGSATASKKGAAKLDKKAVAGAILKASKRKVEVSSKGLNKISPNLNSFTKNKTPNRNFERFQFSSKDW